MLSGSNGLEVKLIVLPSMAWKLAKAMFAHSHDHMQNRFDTQSQQSLSLTAWSAGLLCLSTKCICPLQVSGVFIYCRYIAGICNGQCSIFPHDCKLLPTGDKELPATNAGNTAPHGELYLMFCVQLQVADFNLSRVMEASSVASSLAATNPRYNAVLT